MYKCLICLIRPATRTEGYTTIITKTFLWFFKRKEERKDVIRCCNSQYCTAITMAMAEFNNMLPKSQQFSPANRDEINRAMKRLKGVVGYASIKEQQEEAWSQSVEAEAEYSQIPSQNGNQEAKA